MDQEGDNEILFVGFNQDAGCFACGSETGFKIYNTDPFKNTFSRDFDGGISIVSMLFRWNILAIVGGGSNPKYNPDRVMLWDDNQSKCIGELKFKTHVKGVKMNKETIAVVLQDRIYVYEFSNLKIRDAIETFDNPDGICCLSAKKDSSILACPDKEKGKIRISFYDNSTTIEAHDGALTCLALNFDGTSVASASEKGTLVRIFNTTTGAKLQEVRRGADPAKVYCIAFSSNDMLAVTSDKGTVHVFALDGDEEERRKEAESSNTKSMFGFMKGVLPTYFSSEWSFAQFKFCEDNKPLFTACDFTTDNKLVLVSKKGDYYLLDVDRNEKTMSKKVHLMITTQ